jgi:biopolymer transport protein TolQ
MTGAAAATGVWAGWGLWGVVAQVAPVSPVGEREGILDLFLSTGAMGKAVFVLLALFSLASWTIMIGKFFQLARSARHTRQFLDIFRRSRKFSEVNAASSRHVASALVGLFQAGYVEIDAQVKARREEEPSGAGSRYRIKSLSAVERSLRRAMAVELALLAKGAPFLATTAAASPFIGLFGTVWGIMVAFNDIGATGSTSIVAVAPGIAEALVNTAAGLAAAIPALVGYNYFGTRLRALRAEMEDFILEFMNLTERNFT